MTNLTRRFKLEYVDSNGDTQVMADTGDDNGDLRIDRHLHIRRKNDPDLLKVWLEGKDFGNKIPTRKSEFGTAQNGTDEPEILLKQYDDDNDTFETKGRFFAKNKGTINEQGELALKLYSFMKFTARQSVNTGTTSTNTEDALNSVLPTGYVADLPSGVTPPNVDNYSLNARREKGYQELTRNYKYAMTFTSNLDSNNDYKVKFEPEGQGGTVDTLVSNEQAASYAIQAVDTGNDIFTVNGDVTDLLVVDQVIEVYQSTGNDGTYTITNLSYDSNNDETDITVSENVSDSTADGQIIPGGQAIFKSWEKDKTDAIINKVTVEGTDSNGNKVTGTSTNQTQINDFGEKFLKVKVGYVENQSEAEDIAEKYLVPGIDDNGDDITSVPENGTLKTSAYSDNVVNDSFQVVDNTRNIDDTYTVAAQRNYWPEGATELEFEFEKEKLEKKARESENLRDERARLYPDSSTDVGQQGVSNVNTEDVSQSYDTQANQTHPHDVGGKDTTSNGGASTVEESSGTNTINGVSTSFASGASWSPNATDTQGMMVSILWRRGSSSADGINVRVKNTDTGETYPDDGFFSELMSTSDNEVAGQAEIWVPENTANENYEAQIKLSNPTQSEDNWFNSVQWYTINQHNHTMQFEADRAQDKEDGATNNTNTSDSSAGDTTNLDAEGQTDSKTVNTASEDKTDR